MLLRAFHRLGQAKVFDGGFRLEPIFNTAPAASKNDAQFKSGQNRPISLRYSKSVTDSVAQI